MNVQQKFVKAQRLIECARKRAIGRESKYRLDEVMVNAYGYAEPGYGGEDDVIALGNWNYVGQWNEEKREYITTDDTMSWLAKVLEAAGVEIEWHDEWSECSDCNKLVRTSGDSYGWMPAFRDFDGERLCTECLEKDPSMLLESLEGNPRTANTIRSIDPAKHGYRLLKGDYEFGFHRGMDADPKRIAKALEDQGVSRYLFNLDENSQFYSTFSVYVHESEADLLDVEAFEKVNTDGPSNSEALDKALRNVGALVDKLEGDGVKYIKVDIHGVTEARVISQKDFIEKGIKE